MYNEKDTRNSISLIQFCSIQNMLKLCSTSDWENNLFFCLVTKNKIVPAAMAFGLVYSNAMQIASIAAKYLGCKKMM